MARHRPKIPLIYQDNGVTSKITRSNTADIDFEKCAPINVPYNNKMSDLMKHEYLTKSIEQRIQKKVLRDSYLHNSKKVNQRKTTHGLGIAYENKQSSEASDWKSASVEALKNKKDEEYAAMKEKIRVLKRAND